MPKKYSMIDESNNGLLYGIIYVFRIYSLIVETRLLKEAYVIFDGQIDLFVSVINMANGLHWHHWKMTRHTWGVSVTNSNKGLQSSVSI